LAYLPHPAEQSGALARKNTISRFAAWITRSGRC